MNQRLRGQLCFAAFLVLVMSWSAFAGNTYINNFANIEVSEPDWYEFAIYVGQASGSNATLTIRAHDVDEESGELDEVYINGQLLGYLSGTDGTWSTTSFNITNQVLYDADNTIRVWIDPDGGEATTWVAELDWGQILIDGGSAEDAEITSVSASGDWNAIQVQVGVSATNADAYRLEINLLDSTNNNKDIAVDSFSMSAGQSTTRFNTVSLPSEPSGGEIFTIEANLFNDTTGIQQNVKTTTWTSASEPPTDLLLSANTIDENLASGSTVGTLSTVDPDSVSHTYTLIDGDTASFSILGNQLRTAQLLDHEVKDSYSLQIETEDEDENVYAEWFTITVNDINEAPTAVDDSGTVAEGGAVTLDVLSDDTDPEDDALQIDDVSTPSKGSATVLPGNTIEYVPAPGACGQDTFDYTVGDGNGNADVGSVTVTITNAEPTTTDDVAETAEATAVLIDVLANDADAGGSVTLESVDPPAHGNASIVGDQIRYTPQPRFEGTERFDYQVRDACGSVISGTITVEVLHENTAPTAHAGGFYQGIAGEEVVLDASFSHDPDIGDVLHFRWDLDGDGTFDTPWTVNPRYVATYGEPFFGTITVEVRDVYRGVVTGEDAQATALIRIASIQSIQTFVFEDLDGDGVRGPSDPGISGILVDVAGQLLATEADGGISTELDAGSWTIALPEASIASLEARGFAVLVPETTVVLGTSEVAIAALPVSKTSTRLKGIVYSDVNGNEVFDEEDRPVSGLLLVLDGDESNPVITDEMGGFAFRDVSYGDHTLLVQEVVEGEEREPLTLLTPFALVRTEKAELEVAWPYELGPGKGFLHVDVEREEGGQ